ncbi:uncharacterized protein LOC119552019 [Drosophila subpulchrella]|uniref:uncharacterized protein LOC119552019 n=1 Tax=Drosophila subpulchrella TaxID=1486046 RepID=UPI0018A19091|nr:uncharacterized protein LOC119552019 [Drosophila subpulchrella]
MKLLIVLFALVAAVFGFPSYQPQRIIFQQTLSPQYVEVHTPRHQPIPQTIYTPFFPPYYVRQPMPQTAFGLDNSPTSIGPLSLGGILNPYQGNYQRNSNKGQ